MLDAKVGISPSRARKLEDAPLCQSWAKDGTPRITRDLPRGVEETRVLTIGAMRARGPSRATSGLRGPYRTRGQLGGDDPNVRRRHGPSALLPTVSRSGSGARHGMGGTQVRERPDQGARCSRPRPGGGASPPTCRALLGLAVPLCRVRPHLSPSVTGNSLQPVFLAALFPQLHLELLLLLNLCSICALL